MEIAKSIIIPCYNEEKNIPSLIAGFTQCWKDGDDWELVLVNNGSADGSAQVLAEEAGKCPFARVVTVQPPNIGYGHGIMTGLRAAKGKYLAWTHADGQTPPSDVFKAFEVLRDSANPERTFAKGRRRYRPLRATAFTFGMEIVATAILGAHLRDINAQPKVFSRALLELAISPPDDLSLDLYFYWLAKKNGFDIRTIDVHFGTRAHGESKWAFNWKSKSRNIARSVAFMFALKKRSPGF